MKPINTSITLDYKIDRALTKLPNPSMVLKSKSATMELFHKVARHPDIFPQISSYQSALCGLEANVSAENQSVKEVVERAFRRLKLRSIIQLAASARDYGFAVLEITRYDTIDGYTVPSKLDLCPPECFFFDRVGNLMLNNKTTAGLDVFKTYPGKYILLQNKATLTNPYGVGLLDIAYWVAVGLNGNFEFLLQFGEDDGRDKWVGYYPPGAKDEEINDLLNMMVQGRNNSVAAIPDGMRLELKSVTGRSSSTDLYHKTDEMLRRKVEKLWTGTDLTMQVEGKGGYASSESGLSIREDALQEGIALVESATTQLVDIVCYLNNLPEIPELTLILPKSLSKTIAETDKLYFDMGLKPTRELFLKRGYAQEDFFIDTTEPGTQGAVDFAATPEDYEPLLSAFDRVAARLKKKDTPTR